MRKLVTIRKIAELIPIEGADFIELALIDGWQVIVKKGEFRAGDLCIYMEIDSFLPIHEEFEFLRKSSYKKLEDGTEGFRLRTVRLRGVLSQGLVLPTRVLQQFPECKQNTNLFLGDTVCISEEAVGNLDISSYLNVQLYEPPIPVTQRGQVKGGFPIFIPRTDEERIQNIPEVLSLLTDIPCYSTEKLDGTSFTIYKLDSTIGVCSRNLELSYDPVNLYWKVAEQYELQKKLEELRLNISVQGEIIGPGLAKNYYGLKDHGLFIFSIYDIDAKNYFSFEKVKVISNFLKLKTVPVIQENFILPAFSELLKMADGKSLLNPAKKREGIVIRPILEQRHYKLGRLSFKVISNEYLLAE